MFKTISQALVHLGDEEFTAFCKQGRVLTFYNHHRWCVCRCFTEMELFNSIQEMFVFLLKKSPVLVIQGDRILWSLMDNSATTIQRKWRDFRNRERKYLHMQAIAEYFGHPKRQTFEV